MVIIARELAVTGLRAVAVEQGVVISASWLGKVKTALQIAAVIALIAVDPATTAVDVLVYAAVAVTVISGADYFFGVRRRIERQRARRRSGRGRRRLRHGVPAQAGARGRRATRASSCDGRSARRSVSSASDLRELAGALGDDVVAVDRLEVLLAGEDEVAAVEVGVGGGEPADHLADAVLDEAGVGVGLLDDRSARPRASSARRSPTTSTTRRCASSSRASISVLALLGAAEVEGADAALVVGGDGDELEDLVDLVLAVAVLGRRSRAPAAISSWAHGQAVMPCAWTPVSVRVPAVGGDRGAEQRVDLLRRLAADRSGDGLGVAGGERDLGAHPALAVADALGDPGGEVLGLQRLAEDGLVDRLVDDLLEAGHVGAGLPRVEVDVALELGEEELRAAVALPGCGLRD